MLVSYLRSFNGCRDFRSYCCNLFLDNLDLVNGYLSGTVEESVITNLLISNLHEVYDGYLESISLCGLHLLRDYQLSIIKGGVLCHD